MKLGTWIAAGVGSWILARHTIIKPKTIYVRDLCACTKTNFFIISRYQTFIFCGDLHKPILTESNWTPRYVKVIPYLETTQK